MNDLLSFASHDPPQRQSFSIRELVEEICESFSSQIVAQGIDLDLNICSSHRLLADRNMLHQAIVNLILNSLDVMPDGGELEITSYSGPDGVELEVSDTGAGVPADIRNRLFEPFFTTKNDGAGLGLAIVQQIAEVHGGGVECADCPQGGTAFTLRIPLREMEAAA